MNETFRAAHFHRDTLPAALTQPARQPLKLTNWLDFIVRPPPPRGGAIGSWSSTSGDPLAEVLVVRDEDFFETIGWLNAYFAGLAPVTQWCRVLSYSQAVRLVGRPNSIGLGRMLGAWVGAILAECSVQSGGVQNIREFPGSAAASSATFAAGRATAIWDADNDFAEIARRHDELTQGLREGSRPIAAEMLVSLWSVLNPRVASPPSRDRRLLEMLGVMLADVARDVDNIETSELINTIAIQASEYFSLPELLDCAHGPQVERVRALDRLGERLSSGTPSPAIDALLGLGASFVEPGAAVSPELLRRYGRKLPVAPIWQGAFAGLLAPLRVMTDHGGLGRMVAKSLLATDDLKSRPSCDIAYEELIRWITPGRSLKLDVRGMSARVLSVELVLGVTCAFSHGRTESAALPTARTEPARKWTERAKPGSGRDIQELDAFVAGLEHRIERLESRESSAQRSLELDTPKETKYRKGTRLYKTKGT